MISLNKLFEARPFKTRNADELDLESMLDLFVDPGKSLSNPFEFENVIIKGKMGTGKTMVLRANHAYYLYTLIPSLLSDETPTVPIYIRLSDFQHLIDPQKIYRELILKIIKELCLAYKNLNDADRLKYLHRGFSSIPDGMLLLRGEPKRALDEFRKLSADEYVDKIKKETGLSTSLKPKLFELFFKYFETNETELKKKPEPGIADVDDAYQQLLANRRGKVILLFDEAGSLHKSFFRRNDDQDSLFEVLMNQLRTLPFVRTKIAVYPQTYTDILTETRYGDVLFLEDNVEDRKGFEKFHTRAKAIIEKYSKNAIKAEVHVEDIFDFTTESENPLEQLINASSGNMRRFLNLADMTFTSAYENTEATKVSYGDVQEALSQNASSIESMFSSQDSDFLKAIVSACRSRGAYKFTFPNNAPALYKFSTRSSEYNLINVVSGGIGRRSTVYSLDYAYCIKHNVPTHYIVGTERIEKSRSRITGSWIGRVTQLSEEILKNAEMPGKTEGIIEFVKENRVGFIKTPDSKSYFFTLEDIVGGEKDKNLYIGRQTRFFPVQIDNVTYAVNVELL